VSALLDRIWELRDNVTAYDAAYVAPTEAIECPLLTADVRLSRASGLRCAVTVVPG
jgi:predicted nucleic acid-binding protein